MAHLPVLVRQRVRAHHLVHLKVRQQVLVHHLALRQVPQQVPRLEQFRLELQLELQRLLRLLQLKPLPLTHQPSLQQQYLDLNQLQLNPPEELVAEPEGGMLCL